MPAPACGEIPEGAGRRGRPRRQSSDDRRRHLIDTAEDLFLQDGYHAATMSDIARNAGMSKKTLYQMFASKEALFTALVADRLSVLSLPVTEDGREPATVLVDLLLGMARFLMSPRQIAMTRLMVAETRRSPEVGMAVMRLGLGRGNGALEKWLATPSASGLLRIADPQEAARMLFGCSIGEPILSRLLSSEPPPCDAELESRVRRAVGLFLA